MRGVLHGGAAAAPPVPRTCPTATRRWWCAGTSGSSPAGSGCASARRSPSRSRSCRPGLGSPAGPTGRCCGGRVGPFGVGGDQGAADELAGRARGLRRARRGAAGRTGRLGGARDRRDPPWPPRWTKNDDGTWHRSARFETNFVDLSGAGGPLGQSAGRSAKDGDRLARRARPGMEERGAGDDDRPVRGLPDGGRTGIAARDDRRRPLPPGPGAP